MDSHDRLDLAGSLADTVVEAAACFRMETRRVDRPVVEWTVLAGPGETGRGHAVVELAAAGVVAGPAAASDHKPDPLVFEAPFAGVAQGSRKRMSVNVKDQG